MNSVHGLVSGFHYGVQQRATGSVRQAGFHMFEQYRDQHVLFQFTSRQDNRTTIKAVFQNDSTAKHARKDVVVTRAAAGS